MSIRVLLADDHPVVRRGLRLLIDGVDGIVVVGEAGTGVEAVALVQELRPDVALVDITMPGLYGLEVLRVLKLRAPETRAVIFSMHDGDDAIRSAFQNGAMGYVLKGADAPEVIQALHLAAAGKRYLSPQIAARVVDMFVDGAQQTVPHTPVDLYETLTPREREILSFITDGATSAETADRLCISPRTVEVHRANILRKLNLRSHAELVRYAIQRGLPGILPDPRGHTT